MVSDTVIHIEVAYAASAKEQVVVELTLPRGSTVQDAINASGLMQTYPTIDLTQQQVGIHAEKCDLSTVLAEGDRVEIYRPLTIDPKEARRLRAEKKG